MNTDETSKKY